MALTHLRLSAVTLPLVLVSTSAAQDVKLEHFTSPNWPTGLGIKSTNGCSWGDLDGDGWVDFIGTRNVQVWRNVEGVDWELFPPPIPELYRYGATIGDYDNDGLPDVALQQRGVTNETMKLLHNLGDLVFEHVGDDPNIVDVPPFGDAETYVWLDTDFDGNLDLFAPVYPQWHMNGPGNFFLHNMGPTGPGGAYRFEEKSRVSGLDNPPTTSRPEGAEACDVDGDGDLDVFSNGTLYQNVSTPGTPTFDDVSDNSGILDRDILDEGLTFFDFDMDGDFDLFVLYCAQNRARVYENRGDGDFQRLPKNTVDARGGGCINMSKADWDNDGDIDFTTNSIFRKNMWVETGQARFEIATHSIPDEHLQNIAYTWADWDKDGDQDLLLAPWVLDGHLYDNTLYGPDTPMDERRYVRVRVVRDSDAVERGLETEYGAAVELCVEGDVLRTRRRQFVTSAVGYVNQNEYTLHFALPPDPDPEDPDADLHFDVSVDFNSDPAVGLTRVDRHVNPVLGRVHLADLADREITVYRGGRVRMDDCIYEPLPNAPSLLQTTTDGLTLTSETTPLPNPGAVPGDDWYVGLAFDTLLASTPLRIRELVLDGVLAAEEATCTTEDSTIALWDVSDPANPFLAAEPFDLARYKRNHRTAYPVELPLEPGREYRLVVRVDELRANAVSTPWVKDGVAVHGGLSFQDTSPCDGIAVVGAGVDAAQVYLAVRFAPDPGSLIADLGFAHPGSNGEAVLAGTGSVAPGTSVDLQLLNALPNTTTILVSSTTANCRPVGGGILVPEPDVLVPIATDSAGQWNHAFDIPTDAFAGTTFYMQTWWFDPGAKRLRAASNALSATTPY